jgi:hypothetical protein
MIFESTLQGVSFWLSALLFGVYFVLDLGAFSTGPMKVVSEVVRKDKEGRLTREKKAKRTHGKGGRKSLIPVIEGRSMAASYMNFLSLNRYLPPNYVLETRLSIHERREMELTERFSTTLDSSASVTDLTVDDAATPERTALPPLTKGDSTASGGDGLVDEEGVPYALLPKMQGCHWDGEGVKEMRKRYPDASISRCVRFLVARKGNLNDAYSMMDTHLAWKKEHYPIKKKKGIVAALAAKAFVVGGKTKDGDPTMFFRGAYYDTSIATANDYCLAAAHAMDVALEGTGRLQVVVISITAPVEGQRNEPADINFLKGFVSTLSNNFPERMKAAYIFPFPFFGRVVWSVVKVCMDKRTQDKIHCLGYDKAGVPPEILSVVDIDEMPAICRGNSKVPPKDLLASLVDE